MSRPLRLEYPGACYHVINRGNYRRDIFALKGAAQSFEKCLFEACVRFSWRLHAHVVMRNHFHLALETPEPNLSLGMKWLQGTWAVRVNRFRGEVGRPFQGRYKALHVESGHALAQVVHYIHLNPVRAKVVAAHALERFARSSLVWFPRRDRPAFFVAENTLAESGQLPDTPTGWRRYRDYLALLAEEDLKRREERFGRLSRGWVIGSETFKKELIADLRSRQQEGGTVQMLGVGAVPEIAEEAWERTLRQAARQLKINLRQLGPRKSDPRKVQLACWLKLHTSASNGWIAARLQMGPPASVSQFVRRFRLAKQDETPAFRAALSRVNV